jgi:hypothetical protein
MYGVAGERRLTEYELDWLPGYEGSRRCGSATPRRAVPARRLRRGPRRAAPGARAGLGLPTRPLGDGAALIMDFSSRTGASRTRGSGRSAAAASALHHSKVMAWVGVDRASRRSSCSGSTGRSTAGARSATRSTTRSAARASTTSSARSPSRTGRRSSTRRLLMIPLVGFLPADDDRVVGTVRAIERG